jgi:hypothetical protein
MLGTRKAAPLWRQRKPNLLTLERSIKFEDKARSTDSEHSVLAQKIACQRFEASKGRVRPAK